MNATLIVKVKQTRYMIFLLIFLLNLFIIGSLSAQTHDGINPDEIEGGSFFLIDQNAGNPVKSITLKTDVSIHVTGIILRAKVNQYFINQSDAWMEGVYMFPLPEMAAVDTLTIKIGERIIKGEIKEKQEAKQLYEEAKEAGKKASLLEEERPNMFTVSVANIGPKETIVVSIEYQQSIEYDNGKYSLSFPTVIGPRYIPLSMAGTGTHDQVDEDSGIQPDMAALSAPIDTTNTTDYPVRLRIHLDPGFAISHIESPYLPVTVEKGDGHAYLIYPENEGVAKKRDFLLTWQPADRDKTYTAVFHEEVDGELYSLVMIHPQAPDTIKKPFYSREVIIIIDTSGSMQGESITQAKKALFFALDQLGPDDRFNIIEFNSQTRSLFERSTGVNYQTIAEAKSFVNLLNADGGTEMYPALVKALNGNRDPDRLFQVIFITDGCVGNESELFTYIKASIGNGRLFTVGIGSAPNHYFMRKAALIGRGTFDYIGKTSEVSQKMDLLFRKIANPVLTDISISWSNSSAEVFPNPVPDVYAGEPLTICTKSYLDAGNLEVSGNWGDRIWNQAYSFYQGEKNNGIGKLWAKRKIDGLMDQLFEGVEEEEIKNDVIDVALSHHLVSLYTSLVAVEQVKTKPDGIQPGKEKLSQPLPDGWEMNQPPLSIPAAGTEMWLFISLGLLLILISITTFLLRKKI
ncbi:MAG: marine proteobacterial sortase target protein [Spirochaetales bacterium]|nr:marine proteobacterial sortase target protein [Spirochaetales bacterium]